MSSGETHYLQTDRKLNTLTTGPSHRGKCFLASVLTNCHSVLQFDRETLNKPMHSQVFEYIF